MFIVLSSCLLYPTMLIQSQKQYVEIKYTKNLNNVLNQNVNATKRKRFVTFATSIVDNLCLLYKAISRKAVGKRRMQQSRKAMDVCLQMLKKRNKRDKSRFDSYSARNSVFSISHTTFRDCQVHIFSNNLSRTAVSGTQRKYDCCD